MRDTHVWRSDRGKNCHIQNPIYTEHGETTKRETKSKRNKHVHVEQMENNVYELGFSLRFKL